MKEQHFVILRDGKSNKLMVRRVETKTEEAVSMLFEEEGKRKDPFTFFSIASVEFKKDDIFGRARESFLALLSFDTMRLAVEDALTAAVNAAENAKLMK